MIYHAYARTTGDVDIWLKPNNDNKAKLLEVFKAMDFFEADYQPIDNCDFNEHIVFSMWDEPEKVHFITRINLVEFDVADERKIIAEVDKLKIQFLHLDDLVLSKFNTGGLNERSRY